MQASLDHHDLQVDVETNIRATINQVMGIEKFMSLSCTETESVYLQYMVKMLQGDALAEHKLWRDVPEWRCQTGGQPIGCSQGGWC